MFAYLHRGRRRSTATRLRRLIVALPVVTCGVLGWAGAVPAASASIIPVPADGPYGPALAPAVRLITAGGMPGWQITLIAVAAGLAAAAVAVDLDRARPSRRTASTTG
jgi:hypothetical protein